MSDEEECRESYLECMRSRQERVRHVTDANPTASTREIADLAGVSRQAVSNYRQKVVNALTTNNTVKSDDPDEEPAVGNVVDLRRRRPDWKRRLPTRREVHKWYDQYLGWTKPEQHTARQFLFTESWRLPDAAYYNDNEPGSSTRKGAMGAKKRSSEGTD
jgi:hypothetical protein